MKIKFVMVFLLITVLITGGLVNAQDDEMPILAIFDFEKASAPPNLEINGAWEIVDEAGNGFLRGTADDGWGNTLFILGGEEWTDYAYEMDIRINTGRAYMDFRTGEFFCDVYELVISPDDTYLGLLLLEEVDNDCNTVGTLDEVDNFGFTPDVWTNVRIEAIGSDFQVLINGKSVLSGSDETYAGGTTQFIIAPESIVDVDNVQIQDLSGGGSTTINNPPPSNAPIQLVDFNGTHQEAVAELEDLGLVPSGGRMLFVEDYAWFQGNGSYFTPLAQNSPRQNVAMAGELTFKTGNTEEFEVCSLLTRIGMRGSSAVTYIEVGVFSDGFVLANDRSDENADSTTFEAVQVDLDLSQPVHVLYTVIDDEMDVFINGEQIFDNLPVLVRDGSYGISLQGRTSNSRCEGRNIWVYQFD